MEHYLFYMKAIGLVEPEEERHQWVFHIMVSGHYADWRETQDIVPLERPEPTTVTADSRQPNRHLQGILRFAVAKRPVFPRNFDQIDHEIFRPQSGIFRQNFRHALEQLAFLRQLASG